MKTVEKTIEYPYGSQETFNVYEETGIIADPGKFEGESLYIPYFYQLSLEQHEVKYTRDGLKIIVVEVEPEDIVQFPQLEQTMEVAFHEREDGFILEVVPYGLETMEEREERMCDGYYEYMTENPDYANDYDILVPDDITYHMNGDQYPDDIHESIRDLGYHHLTDEEVHEVIEAVHNGDIPYHMEYNPGGMMRSKRTPGTVCSLPVGEQEVDITPIGEDEPVYGYVDCSNDCIEAIVDKKDIEEYWQNNAYQVIVGNVGTVLDTLDKEQAETTFKAYVEISKTNVGRAGNEAVTLIWGNSIEDEYQPN